MIERLYGPQIHTRLRSASVRPLLLAHTWRAAVAPGATDTGRAPGLPVTRMPFARPGREQEEQPRVVRGTHLAALIRIERRQEPGAAGGRIAARVLDLD